MHVCVGHTCANLYRYIYLYICMWIYVYSHVYFCKNMYICTSHQTWLRSNARIAFRSCWQRQQPRATPRSTLLLHVMVAVLLGVCGREYWAWCGDTQGSAGGIHVYMYEEYFWVCMHVCVWVGVYWREYWTWRGDTRSWGQVHTNVLLWILFGQVHACVHVWICVGTCMCACVCGGVVQRVMGKMRRYTGLGRWHIYIHIEILFLAVCMCVCM